MKTDHIFYRIFKDLPDSFFELIGSPSDVAANYRFDSVELKQTAFRIDGVFLPEQPNYPIYFTEVQFQKDPDIYTRLFSEIFIYLRNHGSDLPWRAVIIFSSPSVEPQGQYLDNVQPLLDSHLVQRIYLKELRVEPATPLGIKIIQLIVLTKKQVINSVNQLIPQIKQQIPNYSAQLDLFNLVETIVLYKLPKISRQELEAMFGVEDLKSTRFAQEMKEEGKIEAIPRLLTIGLSPEQIADALELDLAKVNQIIAEQSK